MTVLFPVPDRIGTAALLAHIERTLEGRSAFTVRPEGFQKSPDHWLLMTLAEGRRDVEELYRQLYSGILAAFRRDDLSFVPHLGLGLFLKRGARYEQSHPRASDFAADDYQAALREVSTWPVAPASVVDTLSLIEMPDEVTAWLNGRGAVFPDVQLSERRQFGLVTADT